MRRWLYVAVAFQILLVLVAVGPRLLPRLAGDEYRVLVEPVDPIDPFRGAYVDLDYGIQGLDAGSPDGTVYVPIEPARPGSARRLGRARRIKPSGPFLRCEGEEFSVRCGIESFFASQREARRLEHELAAGGAVARVKIDGAGRAAIVGLEAR
jgi:uncharacterized membrane-anchored protein